MGHQALRETFTRTPEAHKPQEGSSASGGLNLYASRFK